MHDRERAIEGTRRSLLVATHRDILEQPLETVAGFFDGDPLALVIADPGHERDADRVANRLASIGRPHRIVRPERLR